MKSKYYTFLFLLLELIFYVFILTTGGDLLRWVSFQSIVLCFLYALMCRNKEARLLTVGLLLTVCADFCLVVCQPIEQLAGMFFFFFAQSCYCSYLHRNHANRVTLTIRSILMFLSILVCVFGLKGKADALAIISVGYYAHLIMNIADSILQRRDHPLLPMAFVLFLLCDTVIGLQVMSASYLPIPEGSFIYNILFCDFNLAWFFYLPSQVLIAISSRH